MVPLQLNVCSLVSLGKGMWSKYASTLSDSEFYTKTKIDKIKISAYLFQSDL